MMALGKKGKNVRNGFELISNKHFCRPTETAFYDHLFRLYHTGEDSTTLPTLVMALSYVCNDIVPLLLMSTIVVAVQASLY